MRYVLLFSLLSMAVLFGCLSQQPASTPTPGQTVQPTGAVSTAPTAKPSAQVNCPAPDISFGNVMLPEKVIYGQEYEISAEVLFNKDACNTKIPGNVKLGLYDGRKMLVEKPILSLSSKNSLSLPFATDQTRKYQLTLRISSDSAEEVTTNNIYSIEFESMPFGYYSDTSGETYADVNSLTQLGQGFFIDKPLPVKSVDLYLRGSLTTSESSDVVVFIKPDAAGKPSGANAIQFTSGYATMPTSFGWVRFTNNQKTTLTPGLYYVVVKTTATNPKLSVLQKKEGVFQDAKYSMQSISDLPLSENWKVQATGAMLFKLANDEVVVYDQSTGEVASAKPLPSGNLDPFDTYG